MDLDQPLWLRQFRSASATATATAAASPVAMDLDSLLAQTEAEPFAIETDVPLRRTASLTYDRLSNSDQGAPHPARSRCVSAMPPAPLPFSCLLLRPSTAPNGQPRGCLPLLQHPRKPRRTSTKQATRKITTPLPTGRPGTGPRWPWAAKSTPGVSQGRHSAGRPAQQPLPLPTTQPRMVWPTPQVLPSILGPSSPLSPSARFLLCRTPWFSPPPPLAPPPPPPFRRRAGQKLPDHRPRPGGARGAR